MIIPVYRFNDYADMTHRQSLVCDNGMDQLNATYKLM
jgi:hypothetical protein